MITAVTDHKLVVHLVVYAAFVSLDEEMMVGPVRCGAVHSGRVKVYCADRGRGANLELVVSFLDHPVGPIKKADW